MRRWSTSYPGAGLEVGVGLGAYEYESDRWNIPYSERRERFPEFMEIVKKAWTEECVNYDGKFWQLDNAIALPRPYQKPHPPIWFAGRRRARWSGPQPITPASARS
jgi:alkanesulfonate monooxygenase SsuD/methylene tetrahydromethanopterin reductase-like flavin-dependent oxidoreductase (luciferase family)